MAGSSGLSELLRREAILASFLTTAATFFALAVLLGVEWMGVASIVIALVGGVVQTGIVIRRSRIEREREAASSALLTRVPVGPATEVDPTEVGVDAAPRSSFAETSTPEYLARQADAELRDAVVAALDGSGPGIVIVVGRSKVGKSRALFEALRACAEGPGLSFVAPVDGTALESLLVPGEAVVPPGAGTILWLDDLEPFVNEGITLRTLREWQARVGDGGVIAATYGGKGSEVVEGSTSVSVSTVAEEIFQHAHRVPLKVTSALELDPVRSRFSTAEMEAIERHGLAAYLVAGSKLEVKLASHRHGLGEPVSPEGMAVVNAVVDWARCGRTDPIPEPVLREGLWPAYLPAGVKPTAAGFEAGVEWAVRPVAGSISLVEEAGGCRAYDYVVDLVRTDPGSGPPAEVAWERTIESATDVQALTVGVEASFAECYSRAEQALRRAAGSEDPAIASTAGMNLGIVLGKVGRAEEQVVVCDEVLARFGDDDDPAIEAAIVGVLVVRGPGLSALGRSRDAIATYDEALDRFGAAEESPPVRERLAIAMLNRGIALQDCGRTEEAVSAYEDVIARYDGLEDGRLRTAVERARNNRAVDLGRLGRVEEELSAYDEIVRRQHDSEDPVSRVGAVKALLNKGLALLRLERIEEADRVFEEVVRRYRDAEEEQIRRIIAPALIETGGRQAASGHGVEALALYDEALARLDGAEDPESSRGTAVALVNRGMAFAELGRSDEEIASYDEVVARFGGAEDAAVREQVGRALVNKAARLDELGRPEEAEQVLDDVLARFDGDDDPKLATVAAAALLNKGTLLGKLGAPEQKAACHQELVRRYGGAEDPMLQQIVDRARE